tara:strand:+ start:394 stop:1308 length:915 start_codon:yes stop_codon:yes gene_type:complete
MKILITGGAGFVGTNLICKILKEQPEADIQVLDNYSTGYHYNQIDSDRVKYHEFDVADYFFNNHLNDILGEWKPDIIYHLAALARIQPSFKEPMNTFSSNVVGTQNILEWARTNGNIQVVYAGSSSTHGDHFANPYTFYKYNGELLCELYSKVYDLPTIITRFYNVYGDYMIPSGSAYATVIAIFDELKEAGEPLTITNDGEQRRDFTHVLDICSALIACQGRTDLKAEYFELGTGKNYSINELVDLYKSDSVNVGPRPGEMRETLCTDTNALEILNWKATHKLEDYIAQKVKEYDEKTILESA